MNTNQREKSAIQLIKKDAKLSKLKDRFNWAVQDAKLSLAVKEGKRGPEVEKMKKTRAAMAAAKVDLKDRCGRCRKCMSALGVRGFLFHLSFLIHGIYNDQNHLVIYF